MPRAPSRRKFLESVPWIRRLKNPISCDAIKHAAPLKTYSGTDEERIESAIKYACKAVAYWKFTALRNSRYSKSGTYCMQHLYSQMEEERENKRLVKWYKRYTNLENPTGR